MARWVQVSRPWVSSDAAPWWTTAGRAQRSRRYRMAATFLVIAALHVTAGVLLVTGGAMGAGLTTATVGGAVVAYTRGLLHSLDFDHVSMIDNTTRKFVAEGRRPVSVGLAFSAGHSTVVIATGVLVVSGAGIGDVLLDGDSVPATTLGGEQPHRQPAPVSGSTPPPPSGFSW